MEILEVLSIVEISQDPGRNVSAFDLSPTRSFRALILIREQRDGWLNPDSTTPVEN